MRNFRFFFSVLAISICVLIVEPFSSVDGAFAQSLEEALRLNDKAFQLQHQGRYAEAELLYKRSLAIREKKLGPKHPYVASSLNNLAMLFHDQGRYDEAEPLLKRALAINEKALGPDHPDVANSLNNLAGLYHAQGRYEDAEPLYKRSLAIWEKALGPDHPDVATTLNNLALLYGNQGRDADAEPLHKRSLAIREKALGPDHPDVAQSVNNLALLYKDQGRYADAEPLQKRSLSIWERALGPDHPRVALSLNNLAGLYDAQRRYGDALPIVRRMAERGFFFDDPAFPVLMGSQKVGLIDGAESFNDSYKVLQASSSSAAAEAVNKLAQRFAAGSGELAELVRKDQDLEIEAAGLDKALVAAVSKTPNERNPAAEEEMRKRFAEISTERQKLSDILAERFLTTSPWQTPSPYRCRRRKPCLPTTTRLWPSISGRRALPGS